MKKLLLILMLICFPVIAQDYVPSTDNSTTPQWNDELRKLRDGVSQAKSLYASIYPIDLSLYGTQVKGSLDILSFNNGSGASSSTYWRGDKTWAAVDGNHSQLFVSPGSSSWVAPSGTSLVFISMVGGGGGAGRAGGGSGAWVIRKAIKVTPGNTYTVTVGAAGTGASTGNNGTAGGSSSFAGDNVTLTCNGSSATTGGGVIGGVGGAASGADYPGINHTGTPAQIMAAGSIGLTTAGSNGGNQNSNGGGSGAGNPFGVGGRGLWDSTGENASGYGSGGGGAGVTQVGGNGTTGMVYLEW